MTDPITTLIRKVEILTSKVNEALAPKPIWVTSKDLSRLAGGLTKEQLRYIRTHYAEHVKAKPDDLQSYLYDWNFLKQVYPQQQQAA